MAWMRRGAMVLVLAGLLLQEGRDLVQVFSGGYGQGVGGQQITHVPK